MRLFVLPVSSERSVLYCQRLQRVTTERVTVVDRVTQRAGRLWMQWERGDKRWQQRLVSWGNSMLQRFPYQEWSLRSVPSLSARRAADELGGRGQRGELTEKDPGNGPARAGVVPVIFPPSFIATARLEGVVRALATERTSLHKTRLTGSILAMPLTLPVAAIPILPNIPFFYLLYRAYAHWGALAGSKHLMFLLQNQLLAPEPSRVLDEFYGKRIGEMADGDGSAPDADPIDNKGGSASDTDNGDGQSETDSSDEGNSQASTDPLAGERMLLRKSDGRTIAETFDVPELAVEVERAVAQVESAIEAEKRERKKR